MSITNSDNLTVDLSIPTPTETTLIPETPNIASDENVELLRKQIIIDHANARELLIKHNGNQVDAIMDFYGNTYNPVVVGIAKSSHNISLTNETVCETTCETTAGLVLDYNIYKSTKIALEYKTYLFVTLSKSITNFTKKKKYTSFVELIETEFIPNVNKIFEQPYFNSLEHANMLMIYQLTGDSKNILDKWALTNSGLVLYSTQIIDNTIIKTNSLFDNLNKHATQIARASNIIPDTKSIVGDVYVVGNMCFS